MALHWLPVRADLIYLLGPPSLFYIAPLFSPVDFLYLPNSSLSLKSSIKWLILGELKDILLSRKAFLAHLRPHTPCLFPAFHFSLLWLLVRLLQLKRALWGQTQN